jgi:hypothetical protein
MSEIVKRLQAPAYWISGSNEGHEGENDAPREAADIITRLTAKNEKLKAGLRECEAELNAYYRMEYPGSHPHSQKKLAQAMASNPATVALSGDKQ